MRRPNQKLHGSPRPSVGVREAGKISTSCESMPSLAGARELSRSAAHRLSLR